MSGDGLKAGAPGGFGVRLVTAQSLPGEAIDEGEMVYACAVSGANIVRDMREVITNTFGGAMTRYEHVLDLTIERALTTLKARAAAADYDGVLGVRISHPKITDGAIEVVVAGTGFRRRSSR
ncbi:MAG: heavy metal-binding domain-containing protein [Pseudomonadota bacterium]